MGNGIPDGLLTTKLYVPSPRPGFVSRPRLVAQLDELLTGGVVLVSAPAGFGKTSLLAEWARSGDRRVAWLSLDAGDNDPTRFWRYLIAAVDRTRPGLAAEIGPAGPATPAVLEGLVTALVNAIDAGPGDEIVLVLDDYHLIESEPVHSSITFLLEHLPVGLEVVLACRADPLLPLARLRARGALAEIRAADLRFTAEEAATLLEETLGPEMTLPATAAADLAARTEGWGAGLQLAALSLRGRSDIEGFLETFSGSNRYVVDFLTEEVLERQPEPVRRFLVETSVLQRLCGDLCDAVTGGSDGQAMLGTVERANLFLIPLDETRGWWRYHHLFADHLRARLEQERPERATALHRNAAAWYEEHGFPDDAIGHALAGEDQTRAAQLIERHVDALFLRSEGVTLERWFAALSDELAASRPRLLLAKARGALQSGSVGPAVAALDAADDAMSSGIGSVDEPFEPSVGRAASLLANVPATILLNRATVAELGGDVEAAVAFSTSALAATGDDEHVLASIIRGHLGSAQWLLGRPEVAQRGLAATISQCRAAGEPSLAAWASYHLGQVQRAQGRLDAALETYEKTLEETAPRDGPMLPAAGVAYTGMAAVSYQRDQVDDALRHATEGVDLCRRLAYTLPLAGGLVTLAWARYTDGDSDGAREAMEEAREAAPDSAVVALINPVPAERARLLLVLGDVDGAARWAEGRHLDVEDGPAYAREPEHLVLARILLAQGRSDNALGLLERLHSAAEDQERTGSLIETGALRALALAAGRDEESALTALTDALLLAHPEGAIRVFADEGLPMGSLLSRLIAVEGNDATDTRRIPLGYLGRLIRAFEPRVAGALRPAQGLPSVIDPLSDRELEVLDLIAQGRSNRQIAEELFVALDTVKKHVTHILDKLGAVNRTEASARARQLGLLP